MGSGGETPPPDAPSAHRDVFRPFRRFGVAAARVRLVRLAKSGIGAGPEFPEYPDKGAERPAPHRATGKAFFCPPARIRGNAERDAPVHRSSFRRPHFTPPHRSGNDFRAAGEFSAKIARIWRNSHSRQVQPVRVPAGLDGNIRMRPLMRVAVAGDFQQGQFRRMAPKNLDGMQFPGEFRRARPVFRILIVIFATRVMQQSEQGDDAQIRAGFGRDEMSV